MPNASHEALRTRYRPDDIRLLFLGESPPVGGTFFYAADSNLQRWTQRAFTATFGQVWACGEDFLTAFQALGCYLDDLCLDPVNGLDPVARRRARREAEPLLAARLRDMHPRAAISMMTGTEANVRAALHLAGRDDLPLSIMPFPTFGNQHRYVARLVPALRGLREAGIL
jgi:hypothetical protein